MITINENKDLLAEIRNEWDYAEEVIKRAEMVTGSVIIPSILELRYAGRRIVDALNGMATNTRSEKITELLQDAKFDCHRARHDAIDAATSKIASDIDTMSRRLGYHAILKAYPEFGNFSRQLSTVRQKIVDSRGDRNSREAIYSALEQSEFKDLVNAYKGVQTAEPIMKAIAKKEKIAKWAGYAFGIIGIMIALISLIIQVTK